MTSLILEVARKDPRIKAVLLNGSRANPSVEKDMYQDFDIVYVVDEIESWLKDDRWIDVFGPRVMLQMPERMRNPD
jgi:aminoglycoside 6-adenylyltransferase